MERDDSFQNLERARRGAGVGAHKAYQTFSAFEGISVCMLLNCALAVCCGLAIAIEEAFARTRRSSASPPEDAAGHACDQLRNFAKIDLCLASQILLGGREQ